MNEQTAPAIWFPAVRTGTGTDIFTERLVAGLQARGLRAEITWLTLRAEYAPWMVPIPLPPTWATVCHINTWLHPRFIPRDLPVVATLHHSIHDPALRPYKGWLRSAYHRWWIAPIERRVLRRADRVVAVSRFVADMARQTLCDAPMQVIYNGIDTDFFRPGNRVRHSGEPFRLLYVGSWMARKGVDLLTPIMRELGEGFELRYTGGQSAEKDKPCMPSNMIDIGRLQGDQVVQAMQQADALLFPSRSEGFGLVAAESMGCGLPVIASRSASLTEVVADGHSGMLCPPNDVSAFVATVKAVSMDTQGLRHLRQFSRAWVAEEFSEEAMIRGYINLYREIFIHP